MAAFSSTSGATRDAVCCAPTSSTPSERPRWAMSMSMSLSGPVPSRGAYLLSSSSTMTDSGSRWPGVLLLLERLVQQGADDEALRLVVQRLDRHDGDRGRARSIRCGLARAHEMSEPGRRRVQAAHERGDRARLHPRRPRVVGLAAVLGLEIGLEGVDQRRAGR